MGRIIKLPINPPHGRLVAAVRRDGRIAWLAQDYINYYRQLDGNRGGVEVGKQDHQREHLHK